MEAGVEAQGKAQLSEGDGSSPLIDARLQSKNALPDLLRAFLGWVRHHVPSLGVTFCVRWSPCPCVAQPAEVKIFCQHSVILNLLVK